MAVLPYVSRRASLSWWGNLILSISHNWLWRNLYWMLIFINTRIKLCSCYFGLLNTSTTCWLGIFNCNNILTSTTSKHGKHLTRWKKWTHLSAKSKDLSKFTNTIALAYPKSLQAILHRFLPPPSPPFWISYPPPVDKPRLRKKGSNPFGRFLKKLNRKSKITTEKSGRGWKGKSPRSKVTLARLRTLTVISKSWVEGPNSPLTQTAGTQKTLKISRTYLWPKPYWPSSQSIPK